MNRKLILLFLLFIGAYSASYGQGACPPNVDFEFGNLSYWTFYRGTVSLGPSFSVTACPPALGLHTLTSGTGLDPYGGFPIVDPGGGSYALRLGRDTNNHYAVRSRYYVRIPAGSNQYSLIYRYALVLEAAGHLPPEQPSFVAVAYDSITGKPVPCAQDTFYVGNPLHPLLGPSAKCSPTSSECQVQYLPWQTVSVNLSGMGGKTIAMEFTTSGCVFTAHFGYGYIDMTCGLFAIESKICDDTLATLTGPPGFNEYTWFDSLTFTHMVGNSQIITMPIPDTPTTYAVIVQPFIGFGCPDTLYTRVMPSYLKMKSSNDTLVCDKTALTLYAGAIDSPSAMPLTYTWSPATGLTCTTCENPMATPLATTKYVVTVTDKAGCQKKDTVVVTLDHVTSAMAKVDDSCYGFNNGTATVTPVLGLPPFTYMWSTTPLQTGLTATGLVAGTYSVTVTDNLGCKGTSSVKINQPPANNLVIAASSGPTTCFGSDGWIAVSGLVAGTTYTFRYTFNSTPQVFVGTANGLGQDTIKWLKEGVYDKLTVDVSLLPRPRCPFNTVGPLTLKDPPVPPIPAVGNNGPLCWGDTLKLSATDAVPGVSFDWTGPGGFIWNDPDTAIANVDFFQAGTYTVTVSIKGCQSMNTTNVIVKAIPFPSATGDTACTGSDIQLSSSSSNGATEYRWAGPDAYFSFKQNPVLPKASMKAAGTYTVMVTLDGCMKTDTAVAVVVQTPGAPTVTDTTYCQYDSPVPPLNATGSASGTITWYNAAGNIYPGIPVPNTDLAGVTTWYADDRITGPGVSNQVVCISQKAPSKITVYSKYFPTLAVTDTVICSGNEVTFTVGNTGDDKDGILWSFAAGDSIKDINPLRHSFDAIGTYTISVTPLHKFCPNPTLTKVVNVFPYPIINLGPDTAICLGGHAITLMDEINTGNPRARWLWNTNETGPSIVVTKPGIYYTKVMINGCPVSDTVTVLNDCYLNVPNSFTPNGDGSNDYFFPRQFLTKGLVGFKMDIFNRWGQMIFSSNSLNGLGWDGKFNDVPQPEGVYVYRIDATFKDGQIEHHTGNLTLLR